jgi:TPR repeat protein
MDETKHIARNTGLSSAASSTNAHLPFRSYVVIPTLHGFCFNWRGSWPVKVRCRAELWSSRFKYHERAVSNGSGGAAVDLRLLYDHGVGVALDHAKARRPNDIALDKGDFRAMTNIGVQYNLGWGVAQDYVEAKRWLVR